MFQSTCFRRFQVILTLFVLFGCQPLNAQTKENTTPLAKQLTQILQRQATAWNAGDIDGFMTAYWNSEKLSFSSGGKTTRGWVATRDGYKKRYPTPERMGKLTFDKLQVSELGAEAALVLGNWQLQRTDDAPGGNFSLVFRKIKGQWVIVHDHTSSLAKKSS
jgi:beta-aspartyl-peptidase (threonine type)